uniref:Uncharacterized protein n=1 Tax=Anopheles culicifacies TaxID=139723 RepID=A0A182MN40_9DIPT
MQRRRKVQRRKRAPVLCASGQQCCSQAGFSCLEEFTPSLPPTVPGKQISSRLAGGLRRAATHALDGVDGKGTINHTVGAVVGVLRKCASASRREVPGPPVLEGLP